MTWGKSVRIGQIPVLLLAAFLPACEPSAAPISGSAVVIDGDSLEIGSTSIRLFGVDAFEGRQTCTRNGRDWPCGEVAEAKLVELVASGPLACEERDIDNYGRTVARCTVGSTDLAAELARAGLALAYRQYSMDYVDEEADAENAGRGAWTGRFVAPWDWRRGERDRSYDPPHQPQEPFTEPSIDPGSDCLIKGNINSEGEHIYHRPGWRYYDATVIDTSRGERWFCSEQEAVDSGWRASQAR